MTNRSKKYVYIILLIIGFLVVGGLVVNWYRTYRLEEFLKEQISKKVQEASNGFYLLSFDKLSIGFLSGELELEGVILEPDTNVFRQWRMKDSLPDVYERLSVKSIHLKGINLVWRFDYKRLNFDLFEIQSPTIEAITPYKQTLRQSTIREGDKFTNLYELVSPFFDEIRVGKMILTNASVTYTIEDSITSSIYALRNVNFYAYNFLLNKNSASSGKLLYCDNFEFSANTPQTLLSDSHFILNTENIHLSTKDSIIQVNGVHLMPQNISEATVLGNYVDVRVNTVEVKGISFKREESLNYLDARSFRILYSDMKGVNVNKSSDNIQEGKANNLDLSWSLYDIVSPILHRIFIQNIEIEQAKLDYSLVSDEYTDIYTLDRFDFHANNFLVDSLSKTRRRFWNSESFSINASSIKGTIPSKNCKISFANLYLNTTEERFRLDKIQLAPLSDGKQRNYFQGYITNVDVFGFTYGKGIEIDLLTVNSPSVDYFKVVPDTKKIELESTAHKTRNNVLAVLAPLADYVLVKKINVNDGEGAFQNKLSDDSYQLKNLNLYLTDFLIDKNSRWDGFSFFTYSDLGFSFKDFDNYLPGKKYKLQIKKGQFASVGGLLQLSDVKLIPQHKDAAMYIDLETTSIEIKGLPRNMSQVQKELNIPFIDIVSPQIKIVKNSGSKKNNISNKSLANPFLSSLMIGSIDLKNADIVYTDHSINNTLSVKSEDLKLEALQWDNSKNTIDIGEFFLSTIDFSLHQPKLSVTAKVDKLALSDLGFKASTNSTSFGVDILSVTKPILKVRQYKQKENSTKTNKLDFYQTISSFADNISLNKLRVIDASVDDSSSVINRFNADSLSLSLDGLKIDTKKRDFAFTDIHSSSRNIKFPLNDGFYSIAIGAADFNKKDIHISGFHLIPTYSKTEFAYKHPKHKDWFDVSVGNLTVSDIDYKTYFSDSIMNIGYIGINDVFLQNFKNQKIEIQHNIMPMIYEGLQKLPAKFNVDSANVKNFAVTYEELTKGGTDPGKIFFTEMNGRLTGLSNIVSHPDQYIRLDAEGKLMGTGYFQAEWMLPVDRYNDRFFLGAHMVNFDLRELNQLITPMAPAEVKSGMVNDLAFKIDATSLGATIDMRFLYNDLQINVFKNSTNNTTNKLVTHIANKVIKTNNPNKPNRKPRVVNVVMERDSYHSTFNYLWQILQPAVVESVGVSKKKQNFMKKAADFVAGVKRFFKHEKKVDNLSIEKQIIPD